MSFFRWFGAIVSTVVALGSGYEAVALWTRNAPPPTFSNLVQGLRDGGHQILVFLIAAVVVCILALFGAWLYYHFNYEPRTGN